MTNNYEMLVNDITNKIKEKDRSEGKHSAIVSKSNLEQMAHTLINTPEHTVDTYAYNSKEFDENGMPIATTKEPVKRYRESFKPILKGFGVDANDMSKIDTIAFPKEHAAAMMDVSLTAVRDYLRAGRKLSLSISDTDEARMEVYVERAPEKESVNRFNSEATDVTVTKERNILKAKNSVPTWLKSKKPK